jgi:hypothetical protein
MVNDDFADFDFAPFFSSYYIFAILRGRTKALPPSPIEKAKKSP